MNKLLIPILLCFLSCGRSGSDSTSRDFVNHVTVDPSLYTRDSIAILLNLYNKMKNHEALFQDAEYYDSTILYLDDLIYDSSFNKVALFVISARNPYSDSKLPYYYNAYCYLGKRLFADSSLFDLKLLGPFQVAGSDDSSSASEAIRKFYYTDLTTYLDPDDNPHWDYAVNDNRFWESNKGWKRVFP